MWPSKITYDTRYWRARAEEAQQQAEHMTTEAAKHGMLAIAAAYQRLAQHAEERTAGKKPRC